MRSPCVHQRSWFLVVFVVLLLPRFSGHVQAASSGFQEGNVRFQSGDVVLNGRSCSRMNPIAILELYSFTERVLENGKSTELRQSYLPRPM